MPEFATSDFFDAAHTVIEANQSAGAAFDRSSEEYELQQASSGHPHVLRMTSAELDRVVKVFPKDYTSWNFESAESSLCAKRYTDALAEKAPDELYVQQVAAHGEVEGISWFTYDWAKGRTVLREAKEGFPGRVLDQLLLLHKTTASEQLPQSTPLALGVPPATDYLADDIERSSFASRAEAADIVRTLRSAKRQILDINSVKVATHNDLNPGNIVDDGTVKIIDWGRAGIGSPAYDLANVLCLVDAYKTQLETATLPEIYSRIQDSEVYDDATIAELGYYIARRYLVYGSFRSREHLLYGHKLLSAASVDDWLEDSCSNSSPDFVYNKVPEGED